MVLADCSNPLDSTRHHSTLGLGNSLHPDSSNLDYPHNKVFAVGSLALVSAVGNPAEVFVVGNLAEVFVVDNPAVVFVVDSLAEVFAVGTLADGSAVKSHF